MGCDIHFFAEYREDALSPWKFLPAPGSACDYRYGEGDPERPGYDGHSVDRRYLRDWFDERNYVLFGMLAGVRGDAEPVAEPRGWPADLCPELEAERSDIEHTPCWLMVYEMQEHFARRPEHASADFETCLAEMVRVAGVGPENIRAVFYFDS
tara:strand:- start:837 stop:1295 length:459 start_codon:yes stop_codon:yes gene_type:complete